jgi:SpoVK/Ycf46/Vps4 family AAA+-type ATPase
MFENLVLPMEEKQLLLALTRSHAKANLKFDDFVVGKGTSNPSPTSTKIDKSIIGKGMIMMLDGAPGTGKTLTAESVAEAMKAPLYTMSAGELGLETRVVEKKLSDILEMATMWNAILLIDEADIFMEQRGPYDLQRNELVSSKSHSLCPSYSD